MSLRLKVYVGGGSKEFKIVFNKDLIINNSVNQPYQAHHVIISNETTRHKKSIYTDACISETLITI